MDMGALDTNPNKYVLMDNPPTAIFLIHELWFKKMIHPSEHKITWLKCLLWNIKVLSRHLLLMRNLILTKVKNIKLRPRLISWTRRLPKPHTRLRNKKCTTMNKFREL